MQTENILCLVILVCSHFGISYSHLMRACCASVAPHRLCEHHIGIMGSQTCYASVMGSELAAQPNQPLEIIGKLPLQNKEEKQPKNAVHLARNRNGKNDWYRVIALFTKGRM